MSKHVNGMNASGEWEHHALNPADPANTWYEAPRLGRPLARPGAFFWLVLVAIVASITGIITGVL